MRTTISPNLLLFLYRIAQIKWLRPILHPAIKLFNRYTEKLKSNRNLIFVKNGIPVLKELDEILTQNQIRYSITYGSLLGAIRDGAPIKHDLDFDICMWANEYSADLQHMLQNHAFKLKRRILVDNGASGREETYHKNGVDIDFFYIYSDADSSTYSCCFKAFPDCVTFENSMKTYGYLQVRRLQIPVSSTTIRVPFANIEVSAMDNYEEFLKICYGPDYMTPDPNYRPMDGDNIRFLWTEKKGILYKSY